MVLVPHRRGGTEPSRRTPISPGPIRGVYAILDSDDLSADEASARLEALALGGVRVVQLRFKTASPHAREVITAAVAARALNVGVPVVINDHLDLACAAPDGIWGLHVGQEDLVRFGPTPASAVSHLRRQLSDRGRGLGLSTHDFEQVRRAESLCPDYIGFGPVFPTRSKADASAVTGIEALAAACERFDGPVVAIGGMDASRAPQVRRTGAAGLAAISALRGDSLADCTTRARRLAMAFETSADDCR